MFELTEATADGSFEHIKVTWEVMDAFCHVIIPYFDPFMFEHD